MIGSLRGTLTELIPAGESSLEIILDVGGVGYRVSIGTRHGANLGPIGSEHSISVHTHVREGAIALYGFASPSERKTFEVLVATHGVGPALALAILSTHSSTALTQAIAEGDVDALMMVPGVGKKTAQRLIVELAQRLDAIGAVASLDDDDLRAGSASTHLEVRDALVSLGYGTEEVRGALRQLPEVGGVEELLREALRELAPHR